jgi:hypothetical protein
MQGSWGIMQKIPEEDVYHEAIIGWLIKSARGYYTGIVRTPIEVWTPFRKFAKVYKYKRRAQKIAMRLGGQVMPVEQGER